MVATRIEIRLIRGAGDYCCQLCVHEPMELADAGSVRMACHQHLASPWPAGAKPVPLRRIPRPDRLWRPLAPPHGGTLGTDALRRTREVPPRHEIARAGSGAGSR